MTGATTLSGTEYRPRLLTVFWRAYPADVERVKDEFVLKSRRKDVMIEPGTSMTESAMLLSEHRQSGCQKISISGEFTSVFNNPVKHPSAHRNIYASRAQPEHETRKSNPCVKAVEVRIYS